MFYYHILSPYILLYIEVHISVAQQAAFSEIVWEPFPNIGNTKPIKQVNFIKIFIDGPEVSLNGSPTVSPVTHAALCASEPFMSFHH
jgi:hypothetical protein